MSTGGPGVGAGALPTGSPTRRLPLVLLGALSAFGPLSMDFYLPALPAVVDDLGATQLEVQLTISVVAIGLAVGQLAIGPLSDRHGRRVPILVGVAAWTLAALLCAVSPDVWLLIGIRLVQGIAGAAGIVLARAMVRDLRAGVAAARAFATLASITAVAPVVAPLVGGQVLRFTDWRGVFLVLTGVGLVLIAASAWRLPETLPADQRHGGGLRATLTAGGELLRRRAFLAALLAQGFGFAALFAYVTGGSFVLQQGYGLTAQQFSVVFAINGVGLVLAAQVSRVLVDRAGSRRLLHAGLGLQTLAGAVLAVAALTGLGLPVVLPALFLVVAATGLVVPNATALAMADAARVAGTASGLVGVAQFAIAGLAAPLTGLGPPGTLLPLALAMFGLAALGAAAAVFTREPAARGAPQGQRVPEPGGAAT